jgi:hypothetical protein
MTLEDWDRGNRRQKAIIYTDNQAIRTANNSSGISGVYIAADIVPLIDQLHTAEKKYR